MRLIRPCLPTSEDLLRSLTEHSLTQLNTLTMAPCDGDLPTIGKECFEFCKTLSHNGLAFSFRLTYGDFSISLDSSEIRPMPAQNQVKRKKKSPSQRRRDSRRRSNFLKKKYATNTSPSASLTDLDLEIPLDKPARLSFSCSLDLLLISIKQI